MVKILYNNKIVKKQYTNGNVINKIPFQVEGEGSRLPSGYTEVEYIRQPSSNLRQNTGAWTIPITNMVSGDSFTITFSMDSANQSGMSKYISIFGSDEVFAIRQDSGYGYNLNTKYFINANTARGNYTMEYDTKLSFNYKPSLLTVTNVATGVQTLVNLNQSGGYNPSGNLGVFGYWYGGTNEYLMMGNVYEIKIEGSDDTLKYDYIPCKRDSDNKVGLYDIVNNLFTSPSGFTITAGQEVAPTPQKETIYWQYAEMGTPTPPEPIDYTKEYLTFEPISSAVTFSHAIQTFQYSLDDGETWSTCTTAQTVTVNVGQKMKLKGSFNNINQDRDTNRFTATGGTWKAYGNLLSLLYGDNFASVTVLDKDGLLFCFYHCQNLINVDNLTIPITSITAIRGLRATFRDCGFSSVPSDLLPATTLANECYMGTFEECVNLVKAPTLPATSIPNYGYFAMFNSCTSLNEVTCLATTNIGGNRTQLFLTGTASSGTFYKASSATWSTGQYGVPSGWTVQDAVQ